MGTGAMVARASDLPYLIVGVVLGSIVLIIVTFIPFCLWRAWSKQSEYPTSARTGRSLGREKGLSAQHAGRCPGRARRPSSISLTAQATR